MDANPDLFTRFFQHAGVVNFPAIFVGNVPGGYAFFRAPVALNLAPNYEDKPLSDWPDGSFRSDGATCVEVPAAEIEGEHDLEWLRDRGFEPSGTLAYAQYFATTRDFNHEIVITLLARVASCGPGLDLGAALSPLKEAVVIAQAD